jgi:hypothetical protein
MLAVRKLTPKTVKAWEEANLVGTDFDELAFQLVREWIDPDGQVSIYVINDIGRLPEIAMALSMVTGLGPKGAQFFVVEYAKLVGAKLRIVQSDSVTQCPSVDAIHHDVLTKKGSDLRKLIDVFVKEGKIRSADQVKVQDLAVDAIQTGKYDIPKIATKLKDPPSANEGQKVCNSALRLVGSSALTIS